MTDLQRNYNAKVAFDTYLSCQSYKNLEDGPDAIWQAPNVTLEKAIITLANAEIVILYCELIFGTMNL